MIANITELKGLLSKNTFNEKLNQLIKNLDLPSILLIVNFNKFIIIFNNEKSYQKNLRTFENTDSERVCFENPQTIAGVVGILKKNLKHKTNILCQWSNDEIAIILYDISLPAAKEISERLRRETEEYFKPINFKISIGLTILCAKDNSQSVIKRADEAVDKAKEGDIGIHFILNSNVPL